MAGPGRPSKRIRKLSTDSEGTEEGMDWVDRRRSGGRAEQATSRGNETSRSRRAAVDKTSSATVSRGPPTALSSSPESMRLTVKTSSNKLREATQKSSGAAIAVNSRDQFAGRGVLKGKRARNVKKSYVVESDSDEDEEMVDIADDDDAEGESVEEDDEDEEEEEEEEDEDALGEEDADGDVDMDIRPPPPIIKISRVAGKQTISVKPPKGDTVTVEQKEMEAGSDDEELSELDSDLEVEEEEGMQEGEEEEEEEDDDDAEGEDEEVEVEDDIDDEEEELDSDDETPINGSRASTPDLKSLTKRQRARLEEGGDGDLMALPDEVQVKKHLTAEEHAMRRAEMARRRKNLSEKRNEEEKMETINKLLKKQAPKTNARRGLFSGPGDSTPDSEGQRKANSVFVRWVSNKHGNRIGVPEEWLEGPVGALFQGGVKQTGSGMGGKLIQEVS